MRNVNSHLACIESIHLAFIFYLISLLLISDVIVD